MEKEFAHKSCGFEEWNKCKKSHLFIYFVHPEDAIFMKPTGM